MQNRKHLKWHALRKNRTRKIDDCWCNSDYGHWYKWLRCAHPWTQKCKYNITLMCVLEVKIYFSTTTYNLYTFILPPSQNISISNYTSDSLHLLYIWTSNCPDTLKMLWIWTSRNIARNAYIMVQREYHLRFITIVGSNNRIPIVGRKYILELKISK